MAGVLGQVRSGVCVRSGVIIIIMCVCVCGEDIHVCCVVVLPVDLIKGVKVRLLIVR